jgi:PTH2 family peptidyl-tRNA hydrolase
MDFEYKQAIVVRQDLHMSKGKTSAQAAHASVSSMMETRKRKPDWVSNWFMEGQKKIILKVNSMEELLDAKKRAELERIPNSLISDAGLTELEPGTTTCLGIGPAPSDLIDKVTGGLKLL